MKKAIIMLAACLLVVGFAGLAAADPCLTCEEDPGHIARGCEGEQTNCYPFDYEDFGDCDTLQYMDSYCEEGAKGDIHRALFKICDCITEGTFDTLVSGETVDISMEILVDKGDGAVTGDNGVYWAENVNSDYSDGILMETFASQSEACADSSCYPMGGKFVGEFTYKLANGTVGTPLEGVAEGCDIPDANRVVYFEPNPLQTGDHGYTVTDTDDIDNLSVWWIDIPNLRVDPAKIQAGWKVYVKICLFKQLSGGGVCGTCDGCCCQIYIGELCCDDTVTANGECIFPYFPKANSTYWAFTGFALTNLSDDAGTATITCYEADGDMGTLTVDLTANGMYVNTVAGMTFTQTGGSGTLGDANFYLVVTADVYIHGFVMMGNPLSGESVGYLPECWD